MSYANRLKAARKERGLTQAKLAGEVGITRQTIIQIEDGRTKRTSHTVKIAKALSVSPEWLEFGDGEMDVKNLELNEQEKEAVSLFRRLNEEDKQSVIRILTGLNAYTYK